jgi:KaiC/GvpD/RAD55 family RecA-like ATPase
MFYTQEQIDRANRADIADFLRTQGETLERAGNEYRWKRHDSLTVRENKWYRHSQSKGGGPIDFVMEFYGRSFTEAVQLLTGELGEGKPEQTAPPPLSDFRLPPRSPDPGQVKRYLTEARRIDEDVTGFFLSTGDIYEEAAHHNAVFVGRDESGIPRYAHQRGTTGNFRLDVKGSDKAFNFCYRGEGEKLFVFEAPVDLLSFLCLFKKDWQKHSYLSLGGVGEKALVRFLSDRPSVKTIYLCLDSDEAGNEACSRIAKLTPEGLTVHRLVPLFKDWNEVLQRRAEIADGKYLSEAIYGLREPPQEETVEIIRMSEVDTQTVEWLWKPYIPFGKVTIIQGNPGEGKTTLALCLCAACTNRKPFPLMPEHEPFNVIYQTAEDGLGDTVKPRLMEAEADLDRVLVIDESKQELSLSDERIEKAIRQNGARLIILDPIQAYVGEKTDMNKANEIRPIFRRLAEVAERTACAVILIGHLNKAAGGQSAYRGLGSIDFRAAARSVLLIGRVKREPNIRVIVHDKSSLAPEGKPMAFCLDPETGFEWVGEYDITADELLSGAGGNTATKTEQAETLILDLLADENEMTSEEVMKAAAEVGISERTLKTARRNLETRIEVKRRGNQWYYRLKSAAQGCNP